MIAESFERIHRSNLIGFGVLPLTFINDETRKTHNLVGDETFEILGIATMKPRERMNVKVTRKDGKSFTITAQSSIYSADELDYYRNGGILQYVLRKLL